MLEKKCVDFIRRIAVKYGAERVFLFGSSLHAHVTARDVDLAVEGVSKNDLEAFWDELMWADELDRKPVDIIRIEDGHWLNPIIFDEGVLHEAQPSRVLSKLSGKNRDRLITGARLEMLMERVRDHGNRRSPFDIYQAWNSFL